MDALQVVRNCLVGNEGNVLDHIQTAGSFIDIYSQSHPEKADILAALFELFQSPLIDVCMPLVLFDAHCDQLAQAIVNGDDLDQPTMVEVAVMTCKMGETLPTAELLSLVLSDETTAEVFGFSPQPAPNSSRDQLWSELTRAYRDVYAALFDQTRSEQAKELLEE